MRSSDPGFGIYVHWPFCKAKCPYCDFNSHVRHEPVDASSFADALARELAWFGARTKGRKVDSIFFGGGTPSLMPPAAVGRVLDRIAELWTVAPDAEVTLEANPTSVEAKNFAGYRAAGVNRVSVGVQALADADLKALGRQHTAEEALGAFRLAAKTFPRVSFDLIYARPGQTVAQWQSELARALGEQQGHMSLYQLTIEEGTRYADLHRLGKLVVPDEDVAAELYDVTQELTAKAGLQAYEVSNHAAPGHESRHNLIYWRYGDYAGVGPGAHSRIDEGSRRLALATERHPETWRAQVEARGHGVIEETMIETSDQAAEYLLMGLRIAEGIDLARYSALSGRPPSHLAELTEMGLVSVKGDRLVATHAGRRVLNAVIAQLAAAGAS
ncbi:radical SAM family heme chaperone HemW [Taklimakanibacter deserti]|uniref:radical SAM family heme chaperone HemW n=1 Tax=Taklimakanibacter deserti TaxID=2267839 RepID=UPI000E65CE21